MSLKYHQLDSSVEKQIKENISKGILSSYRFMDENAVRRNMEKDKNSVLRPSFGRDIEKILHLPLYNRYNDKTQVFSFYNNDDITRRGLHVQLVSRISRNIGRMLGLNLDLIESIALGHDVGHTPFGHAGERYLSELLQKETGRHFNHNVHSVRLLMNIENYGKGKNITLQTLDAILCHNGELVQGLYKPINKTKEEFLAEYENTYKDKDECKRLIPMTLEGCVVRISDLIAYLGRDIDDAVRMNLLTWEDVPKSVTDVLGKSNKEIVNSIILDVINESKDKNYIKLSNKVYEAIKNLKNFNYENIYNNAYTKEEKNLLHVMINTLYNTYLNDLKTNNKDSNIIKSYLSNMSDEYKNNSNERIVIDYIAGMTDDYTLKEYNKILKSKHTSIEV